VNREGILRDVGHRPWPLPAGKWALTMRWTDLLFAHWPVPVEQIVVLLPAGFVVDTYEGSAWVGVVPFRMERVQLQGLPKLPGNHLFSEANVRTYVRDRASGQSGVYFLSLDASNPLAVIGARSWYHLPYYFARMHAAWQDGWLSYSSQRLFSSKRAGLKVRYRAAGGEGHALARSAPGTIEHFLTERYALFTHSGKRLVRADIHHQAWRLEPAEAEFEDLSVAAAQAIRLPSLSPLLHYSRVLDVFAWPPQTIQSSAQ